MKNNTTPSFWEQPHMRARMERTKTLNLFSEKSLNTPDQDQIQISKKLDLDRSGSATVEKVTTVKNPDGLDDAIKGRYADLLKQDPAFLQARALGVHPATLTAAIKRMGVDWARQQIEFVSLRKGLSHPGRYLSAILKRNAI